MIRRLSAPTMGWGDWVAVTGAVSAIALLIIRLLTGG